MQVLLLVHQVLLVLVQLQVLQAQVLQVQMPKAAHLRVLLVLLVQVQLLLVLLQVQLLQVPKAAHLQVALHPHPHPQMWSRSCVRQQGSWQSLRMCWWWSSRPTRWLQTSVGLQKCLELGLLKSITSFHWQVCE